MQAITVRDRTAGVAGMSLRDYPHAVENDVIVRLHAAGFTPGKRAPGKTIIRIAEDRIVSNTGDPLKIDDPMS